MKWFKSLIILAILIIALPSILHARNDAQLLFKTPQGKNNFILKSTDDYPFITFRIHKNGRLWNTINNNGISGNFFGFTDEEIGKLAPSYYFPRYSRIRHGLYTGLWIGGIVNNDTLVSTNLDVDYQGWWTKYNNEFWPDYYPQGDFVDLSPESGYVDAIHPRSEVIYQANFTDTFQYESFVPYNNYDMRYHRPLNIKVTQTSYSWSYSYADDFILVDYKIKNLGKDDIKKAFFGLYHLGVVHFTGELPYPRLDDIEGYIDSTPYKFKELGKEPMNIAWVCDKDGNPRGDKWRLASTVNGLGIAPIRLPEGANIRNFNWWVNYESTSWGPRKAGTLNNPLRLFYGELGQPLGDRNKYYMMSHPEVDYSGYEAAVNHQSEGWLPPFKYAENLTKGHFVHLLTSFGPFDIPAQKAQDIVIVYAIGESIHTIPSAYRDIYDPYNPQPFLDYLNFDNLIDNVRWAKRIYDNPGVDTDNDGDSGKYFYYLDPQTAESLKVYYAGDGVPDFKGATPPPPPRIRVSTENNKIIIRWNGRKIEDYFDTFTLIRDFEGYRVYLARSENENDISLIASYDRKDYNRYRWDKKHRQYELKEIPFTLDSLKKLYGPSFEPLKHTRVDPLYASDGGIYYFSKVDYNMSDLNNPEQIHKVYPDAKLDTSDVDAQGRMRYYEYEYVINNLLPTVPYYVSVTAFDFGYPGKSLEPLESSPTQNLTKVFAVDQGNKIFKNGALNVYCYPNPYRIDAQYTENGYENRSTNLAPDRARSIFFANLPNRCTISIYSLDGDLIKRFEHDEPAGSGTASIARFDLITRNTQAIVSGLYYWLVESGHGNQIGKLVIIK